jgi:uncharacterized protein YdeI (YjbR/CyaY-like superfamily)
VPGPTETFFAPDRETWRGWLERHHADRVEVWLVFLKRGVPEPCITYEEALDEATCFGWVDGKLWSLGQRGHAIRFSPRKPGGTWAASNKARVERLTREGRMRPAGLAAVEAAKRTGAWNALDNPERSDIVPADLQTALDDVPRAAKNFGAFTRAQRRDYVGWVVSAKRSETRERRIAEVARRCGLGLKPGASD